MKALKNDDNLRFVKIGECLKTLIQKNTKKMITAHTKFAESSKH